MEFAAAREYLAKRLNMPTDMSSRVIATEIPAQVRAHCFFSARVAEGHVLDRLRDVSDAYGRGDIDLATAREKFKRWYDREKPGKRFEDGETLGNIASTMRLDLVMRQNAAMAAAVGRYQVSRDPDIEERWPCWRYITGPNPRPSHAELDGKVFLKSDPIWHRIYPPWDFNCNCDVEDAELPERGPDTVRDGDVAKPETGFAFDPAEAFNCFDPDLIHDPKLREQTANDMLARFGKELDKPGKKEEISKQEKKTVRTVAKNMRDLADTVKLDGLNARQAMDTHEALRSISEQYKLGKIDKIVTAPGGDQLKPASTIVDPETGKITIIIRQAGVDRLDRVRAYPPELRRQVMEGKSGGNPERERRMFHERHNVGAQLHAGYSMADVMRHEAAHVLMKQMNPDKCLEMYKLAAGLQNEYIANANRKIELYARYKGKPEREWAKEGRAELKKFDITMLSEYAEVRTSEFIAEAFLAQQRGQRLPKELVELLEKFPLAQKKG